jgi:integrase
MPAINLTTARIAALRPRPGPYDTRDAEIAGLIVRTHPSGRQVFYYRFRRTGDLHQGTVLLGSVQLGLAAARKLALGLAAEVAGGGDPAARRRATRAAAKQADTEAEAERGRAALRRFATYVAGPYATHAATEQKRGAETVARIQAAFAGFLDLDINEISVKLVKDWRGERQRTGIAPATIDRETGMLNSMLNHAVRVTKLIATNPLQDLKPLMRAAARTNKVRFLIAEEEARLRAALGARDAGMRAARARMNRWLDSRGRPALPDYPEHFADHLEPIVLTLLNTGLRFGELTQLRWAAVDLRSRLLTVDGDTAKSELTRYVPMPAEVLSILARWRMQKRAGPRDLVFPGKHGRPLVDIKTAWKPLLRRAAIEQFRLHDLRHTYASKLVQRGVDLYKVQRLLGHASPAMTQRYAHLAPDHLAAAVAVLDRPERDAAA